MYQCNIGFYLIGCTGGSGKAAEIIKKMPPLEHFSHNFFESAFPDKTLEVKADVIFAYVSGNNADEMLRDIGGCTKTDTEIILLTDKESGLPFGEYADLVHDIWVLPMTDDEIGFRFLKWQRHYKESKDFWENRQFFEATINNIPNLIWFKTKTGIHEKVNDSFCKTVNKTKEQVEGRGHAYIWNVEHDDPACIESEMEVMSSKKTLVSEETITTGEGTKLLTTYKSPLYDVDGSVMGTVGVAIDVTQERAYEQAIVGKNEALEALFMSLDCGILCHSLDGTRILSINSAALTILGYESSEDLLVSGFNTIAPSVVEEDQQKLKESIESLKKEGDSVSVEYRVRHKDGRLLHVLGNVKLTCENGELYYQRFLFDNTARKLHENKVREENEKRHSELVQALSIDFNLVCFFYLDTGEGRVLRLADENNHDLDKIFSGSLSLRNSIDMYIDRFVCEEDREMLRRATALDKIGRDLDEKKWFYVNYRTYNDSGDVIYYQVKAVRTGSWERDGGRAFVMGFRSVDNEVRSDMEQKKLLENALMQANRANKAKSVFLSNMSHDIRTPMNAIVGFTSLAITHIDHKEQVREYLKKIMTSGNHLLSLINDVLDMSRIESGKMHLEEKPASLPEILHGLRNIIQADINSKQLELYIDAVDIVDEDIFCDKLRLNQVLLNLLSNAVKYTAAGGIVSMRIIETARTIQGIGNYEFHIKDNGIGMSEDFVAHIFEPFERERNTTISGIQGTGLGMAITKNIVDMMNGSIEVKSKIGEGTEVIVSFGFRLNSAEKASPVIEKFKNCRALVVDNDFNACDSVSGMLGQIGMRADWTLSGKEAVLRTKQAVARGDIYSVYIIDWLLPDMNGIEVTRRIRKETGSGVPVIVMTAYDWSDIEDEAREAGVTAFCAKPLFMSELSSCLRSVAGAAEEKESDEETAEVPLRAGRILLTEDNELNQEIALAILTEAGFEVDVANNGQIALDMLERADPDHYQIVLMDIQMPVMNGYEAAKNIRRLGDKKKSSIPIIAMTANAFEEDKQEALRSGMNGHIAKPIDVKNLFDVLDRILK
ncbi:MAG: response regulator [Bacteroides sp.]|nr:response regulator [Bacteroides sp.]